MRRTVSPLMAKNGVQPYKYRVEGQSFYEKELEDHTKLPLLQLRLLFDTLTRIIINYDLGIEY
jgi:hypothetical protein